MVPPIPTDRHQFQKKMVMTGLVSPILDLPQPNHYESLGAMVAMVAMCSKSLCLSLVYLLVKK